MKPGYWVLDADHNATPTDDIHAWSRMFDDGKARTVKAEDIDDVFVSTVFLGVDHNWGDGPPLIFETMIFRGPLDEHTWRWSTWAEAEAGHDRIASAVRAGTDPDLEPVR